MSKQLWGFLLIFLFSISMVSAIEPTVQMGDTVTGLSIEYPSDETFKAGDDYTFSFHIFNHTNGVPMISNLGCYFHLYNSSGLVQVDMYEDTPGGTFEYSFKVLGPNFTAGEMNYLIQCNSSEQGGYDEIPISVTPNGVVPTEAQATLYGLLLLICILLMGLCYVGGTIIDGKNEFEMGKLIKVNYNKYLKQGLFFFGYLFTIFTVYFASEISQNFVEIGFMTAILNWLHIFLWIMLIPMFIIFVTFSIVKWLADIELEKLGERHLKPYGT